jgi:hypothetical protein
MLLAGFFVSPRPLLVSPQAIHCPHKQFIVSTSNPISSHEIQFPVDILSCNCFLNKELSLPKSIAYCLHPNESDICNHHCRLLPLLR